MRRIVIAGSLIWIFGGTLGINACFDIAKINRHVHIQQIQMPQRINYVINASLPSDRALRFNLEKSGLNHTPYMFKGELLKLTLIIAACVVLSVFVLYMAILSEENKQKAWMGWKPDEN